MPTHGYTSSREGKGGLRLVPPTKRDDTMMWSPAELRLMQESSMQVRRKVANKALESRTLYRNPMWTDTDPSNDKPKKKELTQCSRNLWT